MKKQNISILCASWEKYLGHELGCWAKIGHFLVKVCFYPPRISKGGILDIYIMGIKIKAKEQDCRKYISVCSSLLQDILG